MASLDLANVLFAFLEKRRIGACTILCGETGNPRALDLDQCSKALKQIAVLLLELHQFGNAHWAGRYGQQAMEYVISDGLPEAGGAKVWLEAARKGHLVCYGSGIDLGNSPQAGCQVGHEKIGRGAFDAEPIPTGRFGQPLLNQKPRNIAQLLRMNQAHLVGIHPTPVPDFWEAPAPDGRAQLFHKPTVSSCYANQRSTGLQSA